MRKFYLVLAVALSCSMAFGANHNNTNTNGSTSSATGGNGGTGGSASATGGAASSTSSGSNNTVITEKYPHLAPFAYSPEAMPTAPCRVGMAGGGSWLTGAGSIGVSKIDNECDKRETARAFALIGNRMAAAQILCSTKAAKKSGLSMAQCTSLNSDVKK